MSNELTMRKRLARPTLHGTAHGQRLSVAGLIGLAGLLLGACGDDPKAPGPAPAVVAAQAPAPPTWLAKPRAFARELDATAVDGKGLWTTFLSKRTATPALNQVSLVLRVLDPSGTTLEATLARGGSLAAPTIATFDGGAYVVWEGEAGGAACLMGTTVAIDPGTGQLAAAQPSVITSEFPARLPDLVPLPGGGLALAWQALIGTNYELLASQLPSPGAGAGAWLAPKRLTYNETDEWSPSLAATGTASSTKLHIAFDRFTPGGPNGFDVLHMELDLGAALAPGHETLVATGPNYQAYASIAANPAATDEVWIAYEEAPQFGEYDALRSRRTARLAKLTPGDQGSNGPRTVAHAVLPATFANAQRGDFPEVAIGPAGLALTRRIPNTDFQPINASRNAFYSTWRTHATTFQGTGQAIDVELPKSDGDNYNDASIVPTERGFRIVLTTDARSEEFPSRRGFDESIEGNWHVGVVELETAAGFPRTQPGPAIPVMETASVRSAGLAFAERSATDLFGDLHRHTHLSRCAGSRDGTFLDAVRYGRGPGALDFLAITDHYQHLTPTSWWQSKRNTERWNAPGSLLVLPGIERNVPKAGHQNLVWQDGALLASKERSAKPDHFPPGEVIAIPHMTSLPENLFHWPAFDPARHKLVEIHQGLRGSYEGEGLPLAAIANQGADGQVTRLAGLLGQRPGSDLPGMISSSDHGTSSHGYAAAHLAPGQAPTREGLFAALIAGDTTATTGPPPSSNAKPKNVKLKVQGGGLLVEASAKDLAYIEIVHNGELHGRVAGTRLRTEAAPASTPPTIRVLVSPTVLLLSELPLELKLLPAPGSGAAALSDVRLQRNIGNGVATETPSRDQLKLVIPKLARTTTTLSLRMPLSADLQFTYGRESLTWSPRSSAVGSTHRRAFRPDARRPMVDITWMGFEGPEPIQTSGEFRASYPALANEELPPGVYYARAIWLDGNMAWSRFVRVPGE